MPEVVINSDWGGFGLSHEAILEIAKRKGIELEVIETHKYGRKQYNYNSKNTEEHISTYWDLERDDPDLVAVVKELGTKKASGLFACLKVVSVPDGIDWEIDDYDGRESVEERHRSWH